MDNNNNKNDHNYNYNYTYNYNYNYNSGKKQKSNSSSDVGYWIGTVICLGVFWPVGLFMLCKKLFAYYKEGKFKWANTAWQSWQNQYQNYGQNQKQYQNRNHYYDPYATKSSANNQQSWQSAKKSNSSSAGSYDAHASSYSHSNSKQDVKQNIYDIKNEILQTVDEMKNEFKTGVNEVKREFKYGTDNTSGSTNSAPKQNSRAETKQKSEARPKHSRLKKTIKNPPLATVLTILAIILLIIGGATVFDAVDTLITLKDFTSISWLMDCSRGLFFCAGGMVSLVSSVTIKKRTQRFARYAAIIGSRNVIPMSYMVSATGFKDKQVRKDLQKMVDAGYFGPEAYFDTGLDSLVLSISAAEQEREERYKSEQTAREPEKPENKYMQILQELRDLNDTIVDGPISEKISRIEELTAKIFRTVEDKPEKQAQIGRFMDYYLPTTLKLLHAYSVLERQGIEGENISSAKQDIERILDTLADGYEQQLDQLYKSEMMDISSDIDVLETMLRKDGLSDDSSVFRTGGQ